MELVLEEETKMIEIIRPIIIDSFRDLTMREKKNLYRKEEEL